MVSYNHLWWLTHNSFYSIKQKKRLILDLRAVNEHLWKQSVKFEDMLTARQHINLILNPLCLHLIFTQLIIMWTSMNHIPNFYCMCCQAYSYIIYSSYNLVNPLIRNFIKSWFTIDNVPNQINRLVGFHNGISTLGTQPLLIKSHFTWFNTALQSSSSMERTYSNYGTIVINNHVREQEDTMVYRKPKCR
jgi:hypothetical protein